MDQAQSHSLSPSRRRPGALWAAAALLAVALPAQAARADSSTGGCREGGTHTFSPGLAFVPREVTITLSGRLTSCGLADPSISSGMTSATLPANISCSAQAASAPPFTVRIAWDNGRTSAVLLRMANAQPEVAVGEVTEGEFVGAHVIQSMVHYLADPAEGSACGAPAGLDHILYSGVMRFSGLE